ncbi:MAG: hypothetical protein APF76_10535 [Desulfitibacter sp. BRH_c19]|nr:MAG: hypothetical protein APF76_10535 [Desulfitibacter sp. BRH_c19]
MLKVSSIILEDIEIIYNDLKDYLNVIEGSTWLISGGAGFLGSYFLDLLNYCNENVFSLPCKVICIENFLSSTPERIKHFNNNKYIHIINADIVRPIQVDENIDYIIHAASIASPTFYRKYPIETIEANVLGLKNLLDFGMDKSIKSFLFFSTSEIYGDPTKENIPTPENYSGNVSCTGPRACYDESKRLGETLAVNYYRQYGLPVKIVRPFNIYGPGLRLDDKRVIPDFCSDALYRKKISILSDGLPTRSFCYVRDALSGFVASLLSDHNGESFNIGNDEREINMIDLAELIAQIVGGVEIEYKKSNEMDYLTDNPQRRCPDLTKAKTLLPYQPKVGIEEGLRRTLKWYKENHGL